MRKKRFSRLVASLGEVRMHVATGRFAGRTRSVTRDSGNVFADLGYPDAEERQPRTRHSIPKQAGLKKKDRCALRS
jgi:hypothetical protein